MDRLIYKVLSLILFFIFRIVRLLNKRVYYNEELFKNALKEVKEKNNKNEYVLSMWHQNIPSVMMAHCHVKYTCMVSTSKDGELATATIKLLGSVPLRGSSSKKGKTALLKMAELMDVGIPASLAVDGPKGPAKIPKFGAVKLAQMKSVPIVPILTIGSKYWSLRTWDRFRFPKPFGTLHTFYGKHFFIEESDDLEKMNSKLQDSLMELEKNELYLDLVKKNELEVSNKQNDK